MRFLTAFGMTTTVIQTTARRKNLLNIAIDSSSLLRRSVGMTSAAIRRALGIAVASFCLP